MTDVRSWIVVNTHPHKEAIAAANLQNQGFGTYCPVVRRRVRHARVSRDVVRPLFPGYVFVETGASGGLWRPVLSTLGVRALLRTGDEPSRLDPSFVSALRAQEVNGVVVATTQTFKQGQKVKVNEGPFDGTIATIIALDEKQRLVVLMDILNRPVRVQIDARHVAPL